MYRTSRASSLDKTSYKSRKSNYSFIMLGGLYIAGVACGAMVAGVVNIEFVDTLIAILKGFSAQRVSQPLFLTFQSAFLPNMLLLFCAAIFGFCAIGSPFLALLPWFKGLGFGLSACLALVNYGYRAYGYILLLLFPSAVLTALVTVFACRDAMLLSLSIYDLVFTKKHGFVQTKLSEFTSKFMLYGILMLLGALLETALYSTFGAIFAL